MTLKPELDLELNGSCNGNGIDNSPSLPLMRTSPCACLHRDCTADITPAGMWPSHKQDLSPAADRLGVCVSLFQVPPVRPWPVLLLLVRGRGRPP